MIHFRTISVGFVLLAALPMVVGCGKKETPDAPPPDPRTTTMAKTHHDMRANGRISIWLGNIADEAQLDDYLADRFAADFGFKIFAPDGPECTAQEGTDVRSLLEGFSQSRSFVDAAVEKASAAGVKRASTAIVFYNFEYDPSRVQTKDAPIRFIGSVPYSAK